MNKKNLAGGEKKNPSLFLLIHKSDIWICADVKKKKNIYIYKKKRILPPQTFHTTDTPLTSQHNSQRRPWTARVQFGLQLPVVFFSKTPADSFGDVCSALCRPKNDSVPPASPSAACDHPPPPSPGGGLRCSQCMRPNEAGPCLARRGCGVKKFF